MTDTDRYALADMRDHPGWAVVRRLIDQDVAKIHEQFIKAAPGTTEFAEKATQYAALCGTWNFIVNSVDRAALSTIEEKPSK